MSLALALDGTYVASDELAVALEWAELLEPLGRQTPVDPPDWYDSMLTTCALEDIQLDGRPAQALPFDYNLPSEVVVMLNRRRPLKDCFQTFLDTREEVFLRLYGSPESALSHDPRLALKAAHDCALAVETELRQSLFGQSEAVAALKRLAFQRELRRGVGPSPATALFLGPPGSGKSLAARLFAEALGLSSLAKHRSHRLAVLDVEMTQHVQWNSGVDLFGDGTRQGFITKFVEANPHALVICNEFEKAHRMVLQAVLPVLDQGFLPSPTGKVDFRDTVFIFTTNLGSELWNRPAAPEEGTLEVDLLDLLSLAEKVEEKSDWHKTPVPKELLSRLNKGAMVLFRRHLGHHMLQKAQQSGAATKRVS
ncbi:MAG: ATP-dependent Clp protease ATP-binding subunit [Geothrix sp.]|nr:ATP-dependent Clp protease ATP-binding subunit [Geothrix sp.]